MSWQAGPHPDDAQRPPAVEETVRVFPRRPQIVMRPRADTRQAVTLELLPLVPPGVGMLGVMFVGGWSLQLVVAAAVVTAVAAWVVARRDRGVLEDRGFAGLPTAALALVSPILYLVVRARACAGHDRDAGAPIPWAIASTAVAIVVVLIGSWFQAAIGGLLLLGG